MLKGVGSWLLLSSFFVVVFRGIICIGSLQILELSDHFMKNRTRSIAHDILLIQ